MDRAIRSAYIAAAVVCLGIPLALQIFLGALVPAGRTPVGELVQQVGYTFTAASFIALALAARLGRKALARFARVPAGRRAGVAARGILWGSSLSLVCVLCGCLHWALAGPAVERHARTFLALGPVGFILFVPRPARWASALPGS